MPSAQRTRPSRGWRLSRCAMGAGEDVCSRSVSARYGRIVGGFRYALHSPEGDELGEFTTIVPNWTVGDEFLTGDGRRFRILKMVPVFDEEGSICNAIWMVEEVNGS
jgi:hypothetical protein